MYTDRKSKLLIKYKNDLSLMEYKLTKFLKTNRYRYAKDINKLTKDIDMLDNIIMDLEYEIDNDMNFVY